jgi:hypothetical protein
MRATAGRPSERAVAPRARRRAGRACALRASAAHRQSVVHLSTRYARRTGGRALPGALTRQRVSRTPVAFRQRTARGAHRSRCRTGPSALRQEMPLSLPITTLRSPGCNRRSRRRRLFGSSSTDEAFLVPIYRGQRTVMCCRKGDRQPGSPLLRRPTERHRPVVSRAYSRAGLLSSSRPTESSTRSM